MKCKISNPTVRLNLVEAAVKKLKQARQLCADAGAPKTADKIRSALRSAGGAVRNRQRFADKI